jgi:two-component system sensor histidine kinase PilS (NtrC family)
MKRLCGSVPKMLLDADKVAMALARIVEAAVERSSQEGWLRVETDLRDGCARFQVTWEERSQPGSLSEDVFVPFGPLDSGGTGLSLAWQIIRQHGGGVRVRRFQSGSTALVIDLPVGENKDRRRLRNRRSGLDRRRPS